jgi:hypothetical protein
MKALRWLVIWSLVIYAGWLTIPLLENIVGANRLRQMVHVGGPAGLTPDAGDLFRTGLWVGAILFFFGSALLLCAHSRKAFGAYALGFAANAVLILMQMTMGSGAALPLVLLLLGLVLVGWVIMTDAKRRRIWA